MRLDLPAGFDVAAAMEPSLESSRRTDGWIAARQRDFCAAVAAGATIGNAARSVGLSASSAYAFRNSAKGAAFNVAWNAAQLLQRQRLADEVAARAFEGQTVTITRPDGSTHQRHFYDNRHAMAVLARLDRLAAGQATAGAANAGRATGAGADASGEGQAARLAAAEFDRFLDTLSDEGGPARAGLFLASRTADEPAAPELAAISTLARADLYGRTGAGVTAEIAVADLDLSARAGWTADQWLRAEAAGLLVLAPKPAETATHSQHSAVEDERVWRDEDAQEWRTNFPPTADVNMEEWGDYGDEDYQRTLTLEEEQALDEPEQDDIDIDADAAERDRWFAAAARRKAATDTAHQPAVAQPTLAPDPSAPDRPLLSWPHAS